jgi:hypothetical protein
VLPKKDVSLPRVDFTNVLPTAFTLKDPKKRKMTVQLLVSYCAFGTYGHEAEHETLVKPTPRF